MSFILQFFDAPEVNSVQSAADYVDLDQAAPAGANAKFGRFVESVKEFYPDQSEDEGFEFNLWPEGLTADATDLTTSPAVNIAINLDMLDPGVMTVIAQHATKAGLQILDPQNALLYLLDGTMISAEGDKENLPPVSPFARSVMTENVKGMGLAATAARLADGLLEAWEGRGFTCVEVPSRWAAVLWRQHGDLRQMLDIRCMRSTNAGAIRFYVRMGFACESIAAAWLPLLPEKYLQRKARYDTDAGGVALDVALFLPNLRAGKLPGDARPGTSSEMIIRSLDELDAMLPTMRSWTQRELLPLFESVESLADLSDITLTDAMLEHCETGMPELPMLPGLLVLAARRDGQTLEQYVAAYRRNKRLPDLWKLYGDPKGAHFDKLVAGLKQLSPVR
jgi:hypothetical protein